MLLLAAVSTLDLIRGADKSDDLTLDRKEYLVLMKKLAADDRVWNGEQAGGGRASPGATAMLKAALPEVQFASKAAAGVSLAGLVEGGLGGHSLDVLKAELRAHGLETGGNKLQLYDRLYEALQAAEDAKASLDATRRARLWRRPSP